MLPLLWRNYTRQTNVCLLLAMAWILAACCSTPPRSTRANPAPPVGPVAEDNIRITYLGTSTLLFEDNYEGQKTKWMIDGFFTRPCSIFSPMETSETLVDDILLKLKVDRMKAVLVAHAHYDHALDSAYVAKKTHAILWGSRSVLKTGAKESLVEGKTMKLMVAEKPIKIGAFTVIPLKGQHSPEDFVRRTLLGGKIKHDLKKKETILAYKEGGCFDFLILHPSGNVLVTASANTYPCSMAEAKHLLGEKPLNVLFLATGGLSLQSADFREKYYRDTVTRLKPLRVIPVHWDDFFHPLSTDMKVAWHSKYCDAQERTQEDRIPFKVLQGYDSITLPEKASTLSRDLAPRPPR